MNKVNFFTCCRFVMRGVAKAKPNPEKVQLTEEQLKALVKKEKKRAKLEINDAEENSSTSDFDEFDDDSSDAEEIIECKTNTASTSRGKEESKTKVEKMEEDEVNFENYDKEDDSGAEDDVVTHDDNLILLGHVKDDRNVLEVYVYNEKERSLSRHHDLLLPTVPLCIEWLTYNPINPTPGNLCAIGTIEPIINIWDLGIIDCVEPAFRLGSKKKKIGHTDAVLDIAWNPSYDHILASGSADKTVLLWDMDSGGVHTKLDFFKDKVKSLCWHPLDAQILLAGGCDTVTIFDCRQTEDTHMSFVLGREIERTAWDPLNTFCFLVGTSDGLVSYIDCRNKEPVWAIKTHEKRITGLSISKNGLLVTTSSDGFIRTWDSSYNKAELVSSQDMKIGDISCLSSCPENPFVVCSTGNKEFDNFVVCDLRTQDAVAKVWQ